MLTLYWSIGQTILDRQNAEGWGARVIDRLADDLRAEFPDMRGLPEWEAHVAPLVALDGLGRLVAEQRAIEASIEEKVRLARRHGASWSDIGRAARMSKHGAQQRWGATF